MTDLFDLTSYGLSSMKVFLPHLNVRTLVMMLVRYAPILICMGLGIEPIE